ncbi:DEAD/DEAH box helicase [bacterium]|nr:DEAD/DEAH box helicase [bacterium]
MPPGLSGIFHPLIADWFSRQVGTPTDIQLTAWPAIARGEHVLITAPTGSGKTLTAFLWSLDSLITGRWDPGRIRVLYVSPLKALNNDIYRNLELPLRQLHTVFHQAGEPFPEIRIMTRSGDTPQSDRRRMLRHPPEILITTPESLNILLSSESGRSVLSTLTTVILDEIHAVISSKRGAHLMTAVDRLVPLCGEFQRIALSATVKPPDRVAEFIGGFRPEGPPADSARGKRIRTTGSPGNDVAFAPRSVRILQSEIRKNYCLSVCFPGAGRTSESRKSFWDPFIRAFREIVQKNRSTLFFVNSRKLAETVTLRINAESDHPLVYAHHGSLSREIRLEVEQRLKTGSLKAIVATGSLEMGIDIGDLDKVVLVQSPQSVSTAVQRIGRAGHRVGEISHADFIPTEAHDLLEAAVLCRAVLDGNIESVAPVDKPLDVLAQVIVSMTGTENWDVDRLFDQLRTSAPYRGLTRKEYDLVLGMLAGRYQESRIRELKPRISIDRTENRISAAKGAKMALFMSGGTIPDRGYYHLRHADTGARIGELDEEFVWEARLGQNLTFGTQHWRIEKITHSDVLVRPGNPNARTAPFWKGERPDRDVHLSDLLSGFLNQADRNLDRADFHSWLTENYCLDDAAAAGLTQYLRTQKHHTGVPLPHKNHVVFEYVSSGPGGVPGFQLIIHTFWGGVVNRPFAMILDAAWEERFGEKLEVFAGNDCVVLMLAEEVSSGLLLQMLLDSDIKTLLRKRLEGSGFFGARFREAAGRALLLQRTRLNERMPLWMSRLRSQKLLNSVMSCGDFPILLEAWRTCVRDHFDLKALEENLESLKNGVIAVSECRTTMPSPMAAHLTFRQINEYMYRDDVPGAEIRSGLTEDLLRDIVYQADFRPQVPRELISVFEQKRQRLWPGYTPSGVQDLLDLIKERWIVPEAEWNTLMEAMIRDHENAADILLETGPKLTRFRSDDGPEFIIALENEKAVAEFFDMAFDRKTGRASSDRSTLILQEWFSFYGPGSGEWITQTLGIPDLPPESIGELTESGKWIRGYMTEGDDAETWCDAENFEILLRMLRSARRTGTAARPLSDLPAFLAMHQNIIRPADDADSLARHLELLFGIALPAQLWESELLPARSGLYRTEWLDQVLQQNEILWLGTGSKILTFVHMADLDLFCTGTGNDQSAWTSLFADPYARYNFTALLQASGLTGSALNDRLWKAVWKGSISNDSFGCVRKGLLNNFRVDDPTGRPDPLILGRGAPVVRRARYREWKGRLPWSGNWFLLPACSRMQTPVEQEESARDRVRILLMRYGILFRELLLRETPPFQWPHLFRSLRLMELSGEVIAGQFFSDIPGPQFISPQALELHRSEWDDTLFWLNASDPASVCGLPYDPIRHSHPRRSGSTHLVYRGSRLILISLRHGKSLEIRVPPEDTDIRVLAPLKHMLERAFNPLNRITIETINEEKAAKSPYAALIKRHFDCVQDHRTITLYRPVQ